MNKACLYLKKNIQYVYFVLILVLLVLFRGQITNLWMKCIGNPLFSGIWSSSKNDIIVLLFFLISFIPFLFWAKRRIFTPILRVIPLTCLITISIIYIWFRTTNNKLFVPFHICDNVFYADIAAFYCILVSLITSFSKKSLQIIDSINISNPLLKSYFISNHVDYAVMINGPWGIGKSSYWRYILKTQLEEVGYKTIYVSLFGLSDVSELKDCIQEQLHPLAKHPISRAASSIGNSILGLLGIKWSKDDTSTVIDSLSVDWSRIVLCFDDIERAPEGDFLEMMGCINSFVEQHNSHVLLISDEEKIEKNDKKTYNTYSNYKEKLVRFTVQFKQDFEESFNNIINNYCKNNSNNTFYISYSEFIRNIFVEANCMNLRSVILCLDVLKYCWEFLKDEHLQEMEYIENVHRHYAYLSAVYSIVYQESGKELLQSILNISEPENDSFGLDFDFDQTKENNSLEDETDRETSEKTKLINATKNRFKRYIPYGKYGRSNVIFNFLTTGYFDYVLCFKEFNNVIEQLNANEEKSSEQYYLNKLRDAWNMKDDDLQSTIDVVITLARLGGLDFSSYPELFSQIIYLKNNMYVTVKESDSELEELFISGLEKTTNRNYKENLEFQFSHVTQRRLVDKVIDMNKQILQEKDISDFSTFLNDPNSWDKLYDYSKSLSPLYSNNDPQTIFNLLLESDGNHRRAWMDSVIQRLDSSSFQTEEKAFFEEIKKLAAQWIEEHENSVTRAFCGLVSKLSEKVINSFSAQ